MVRSPTPGRTPARTPGSAPVPKNCLICAATRLAEDAPFELRRVRCGWLGGHPYCRGVQAVYYRDSKGVEPVNAFIDALPPERQEELDFKIGLLNRLSSSDPPLPFPHSSQVEGQLRELRCHYGRDLYRILYQRSGSLFVLLHALEKRTGALPGADVTLAQERFAD